MGNTFLYVERSNDIYSEEKYSKGKIAEKTEEQRQGIIRRNWREHEEQEYGRERQKEVILAAKKLNGS